MNPRFIIQQKITAFVNKYIVLNTDAAGEARETVALAQQKRLAFKERVIFYTDEHKTAVSFTFRAEKVMDVHGRYFVEDSQGQLIGTFKKQFTKSLLNSTWSVFDVSGKELFVVKESNQIIAIMRRFIGFVPFIGDLLAFAMNFFKYHFSFIDINTNQEVGQYKKTTLFRDHYQLLMTDEAYSLIDNRVLAAVSVALDALQSR